MSFRQSDAFETTLRTLVSEYSAHVEELAKRLGEAINTELESADVSTYEQRHAVSEWIREVIRPFGLAIECPKTGKSCSISAHHNGHFRLRCVGAGAKTTFTSKDIFEVKLIPHPPHLEWTRRVAAVEEKSTDSSRIRP